MMASWLGGLGGTRADLTVHDLEATRGPPQAWLSAAELGRIETGVVDEGLKGRDMSGFLPPQPVGSSTLEAGRMTAGRQMRKVRIE